VGAKSEGGGAFIPSVGNLNVFFVGYVFKFGGRVMEAWPAWDVGTKTIKIAGAFTMEELNGIFI
jgi:hypothetical protein